MNERSSRSSQVGLFSEQISEQVGRLRVLTGTDADRADGVALKRAVMATRLLAGSARILHVDELVSFLDELLTWLQWIGEAGHRATPTQSLILDAVISFEETLMRQLEGMEEAQDLSSFAGEIGELRGLIRKNLEKAPVAPAIPEAEPPVPAGGEAPAIPEAEPPVPAGGEAPAIPEAEPPVPAGGEAPAEEESSSTADTPTSAEPSSFSEAPSGEDATSSSEKPSSTAPPELEEQIVEAMGTLADWLDGLDHEHREELATKDDAAHRLRHLQSALNHLLTHPSSEMAGGGGSFEAPGTCSIASDHPLVLQLARAIETHTEVLQGRLEYHIEGQPGELDPHRAQLLGRVLDHLIEDACDTLEEMLHEEDAPPVVRLSIVFESGDHRVRIVIEDNGPSLGAAPALDHADPLGLYRGLRRSRSLIEELHGVILVEPADRPGSRFVLSLPRNVLRPVVRVLDLGRTDAAISGFLVDEVISTDGLLFHRDTDGEHFIRNGRPVPLVDLAEYLSGLEPLAEEAGTIVIVGSVEKRLGIYCHGIGEEIEASSTEESLQRWQWVSRRTVQLDGRVLPLLSVRRLLELRMAIQLIEEPGSVPDPVLDAYIPISDDTEFEPSRASSADGVHAPELAPEAVATPGNGNAQEAATEAGVAPEMKTAPMERPGPEDLASVGGDGRAPRQPAARSRVLLVNQSEFRLRELQRMLEESGYLVTTAPNLTEGLQLLQTVPVDLVITDLRLGDKGAAGLPDLHKLRPQLKVILTSSVAREYAEELARRAGADACWLQPYRLEDLREILQIPG